MDIAERILHMHLITVAIAAYNVEKYIAQMLDSILAQNYSNLEILVINDGSTDNTLDICQAYTDPRIRIITKENGGLSTARQMALDHARGTYLCMVDGDDILAPNYVKVMYEAIVKAKADVCVCEYQEFVDTPMDQGNRIGLPVLKDHAISAERLENSLYSMVLQYKLADSWNKMYRVEFLRNTGIRFFLEKQYNGTDLFFNHAVALHRPIYTVVHEVLLYYRLTPNSRVRRKDKDLQTGFEKIIAALLDELNRVGYSEKVKQQIYLIYLDMIRRALADRYKNSDSYMDFKGKYKLFRKKHTAFVKKYFVGISHEKCSKGMKLFNVLIALNIPLAVYKYLKFRNDRVQKTIGR